MHSAFLASAIPFKGGGFLKDIHKGLSTRAFQIKRILSFEPSEIASLFGERFSHFLFNGHFNK